MHLVFKNLFQFDEAWVLIAGVAKLIFDCCSEIHYVANWLLQFDFLPQLVIRYIKTLPGHVMELNLSCKTAKLRT